MEITITIKIDENEVVTSKTKMTDEESKMSVSRYARFFDESNTNWCINKPEYNLMFLRSVQQWANDALVTRRKLYLNEVYDALGMEKTEAGQFVGWVYNKDDPTHVGDNHVDFGIQDLTPSKIKRAKSILLDFNVDGVVVGK